MSFFIDLLESIWNAIKKIFLKVISFAKNIAGFFKNSATIEKLKNNNNLIAISIKEKYSDGNYRVVNCLFNKVSKEVAYYEENALGMEAEQLDDETKNNFGNKDMLILK